MSDTLEDKQYASEDLSTSEKERYELQDGILIPVYDISYAHSRIHFNLGRILSDFLQGKKCRLLGTMFPVYLFYGREDVPADYLKPVCPDIMVVCDLEKLDAKKCKGAPDFVIEIISSNRENDEDRKFDLYEKAGVKEYWMVYPEPRRVHVSVRDEKGFTVIRVYRENDKVPVSVLPGCVIDLEQVFGKL